MYAYIRINYHLTVSYMSQLCCALCQPSCDAAIDNYKQYSILIFMVIRYKGKPSNNAYIFVFKLGSYIRKLSTMYKFSPVQYSLSSKRKRGTS